MFKRFISSIFLGLAMFISVHTQPAVAGYPHVVIDISQNVNLYMDLMQMVMALKEAIEILKEAQHMHASIGELKSKPGRMFRRLRGGMRHRSGKFMASYFTDEMKKIGLETAQREAHKVRGIVAEHMLPRKRTATAEEALAAARLRRKVREATISEIYASGLAYNYESTNAQTEILDPAVETIQEKETVKAKLDGANEIQIMRLNEQIEGNRLMALHLRLMAADRMSELPSYEDAD